MRKFIPLAALVLTLAATTPSAAQSAWDWSGFPEEETRAVLGCSDAATDEDWVCLAVRCEAPGELGLYAELSDFQIPGTSNLRIGTASYAVEGTQDRGDAPYSTRLIGDIAAIAEAMKAGSSVTIEREAMAITPGFDVIPLRGSAVAIEAVQKACGASDTKVKAKEAPSMLPLRHGIYVRSDVACNALSHATTLSFWGNQLNAQRVEGIITDVSGTGPDYRVTLDATDIAENASLGILEWGVTVQGPETFSVTDPSPADSYRWCFDAMPA